MPFVNHTHISSYWQLCWAPHYFFWNVSCLSPSFVLKENCSHCFLITMRGNGQCPDDELAEGSRIPLQTVRCPNYSMPSETVFIWTHLADMNSISSETKCGRCWFKLVCFKEFVFERSDMVDKNFDRNFETPPKMQNFPGLESFLIWIST